jgi:hypothetical protein
MCTPNQDLKIGDLVIAKAGAKAVGTITHAKRAGLMGKAGELNMRLQYLIVADTRLKLPGTKGKEGQGKEGTTVADCFARANRADQARQKRGHEGTYAAPGLH